MAERVHQLDQITMRSNAHRSGKLALCRKLLSPDPTGLLPLLAVAAAMAGIVPGPDRALCPVCRTGFMARIATVPRVAAVDSS